VIMARHEADRREEAQSARETRRRGAGGSINAMQLRYTAAALSAFAALAHNWALPAHAWGWWGYGLFFLVSAVAQGFYSGLLLIWPSRFVFLAGITGNAAIVALYAVSRTLGVPFFGPHAGRVEAVGVLDFATAIAEVALVFALVHLIRDRSSGTATSHPSQRY
jgi:hypothetical protein